MQLFLKMLLAHLVGDFILQPDSWVNDKNTSKLRSPKLFIHLGIQTILLALVLGFNTTYWLGYILILLSHLLIDAVKIWLNNTRPVKELFFLDQAAHIAVIALAASIYQPIDLTFTKLISGNNLILFTALVFVTFTAAVIVKVSIAQWNPEQNSDQDNSLSKAGRFIGILERLFVFIFVINGHWQAIGFLLAAKSVFRFGNLKESKDRKLTEYILIGPP